MSESINIKGFKCTPKTLKVTQIFPVNTIYATEAWGYEETGGIDVYVKVSDITVKVRIPVQTMAAYNKRYAWYFAKKVKDEESRRRKKV